MKKISCVLLFLFLFSFLLNAEGSGYDQFLARYLDTEVAVYILNESVIHGKLVRIYDDGIVVKPLLRQMTFIAKDHIVMIETKVVM